MSTLRIHRLRAVGSDYWALRFGGERDDFMALVRALKSFYPDAMWNPDAFGKKHGGWLVRHHTLLLFKDRFENWQECIDREHRRQAFEQRQQELAAIEQVRREFGIPRDINECPF